MKPKATIKQFRLDRLKERIRKVEETTNDNNSNKLFYNLTLAILIIIGAGALISLGIIVYKSNKISESYEIIDKSRFFINRANNLELHILDSLLNENLKNDSGKYSYHWVQSSIDTTILDINDTSIKGKYFINPGTSYIISKINN